MLGAGATEAELNAALDAKTAAICDNIKAAGIKIFVVRLELADTSSQALLSDCASGPDYYLDVTDSAQLDNAFDTIADRIKQFHLTK